MIELTRGGTGGPVSRDQILRREPGQGTMHFPCSADHEQNCQPCPVNLYPAIYVMTKHVYGYSTYSMCTVYSIGFWLARVGLSAELASQ